eukprot:TRINITY_DN67819_c0_g1_i1.p1 TRINITY_DN67819_c0_g1~~TRINITY_DN67819_c0_g1_i1.p1  ORF type:complete len:232 (-),score=29.53 TRINITY_DN67819_c0_g1_i1:63-674(-)
MFGARPHEGLSEQAAGPRGTQPQDPEPARFPVRVVAFGTQPPEGVFGPAAGHIDPQQQDSELARRTQPHEGMSGPAVGRGPSEQDPESACLLARVAALEDARLAAFEHFERTLSSALASRIGEFFWGWSNASASEEGPMMTESSASGSHDEQPLQGSRTFTARSSPGMVEDILSIQVVASQHVERAFLAGEQVRSDVDLQVPD